MSSRNRPKQTVAPSTKSAPTVDPARLEELDALVSDWITLPDLAERMDVSITDVRRMLEDDDIAAVRRGNPKVLSVPLALADPEPLHGFAGTLTVLRDGGFEDVDALIWLFTPQDDLGGTPVDALRGGRKTEIRRRAMLLAL